MGVHTGWVNVSQNKIFIIMPALLRKIEANILENFTSQINMMGISGTIGMEDYIKIGSFEAFLQNFSKAQETYVYGTPAEFGLKRNKKEEFIELEISY